MTNSRCNITLGRGCWLWAGLAALLACALAGCASRTTGYKITDETVAFIKPGVTTHAELVENLGEPLLEIKDPHTLAYTWGKVRPIGGRPAVEAGGMQSQSMSYAHQPVEIAEIGAVEARRWVFCIALDGQDRVQRFQTVKLQGETSLEGAVRRWALGETPTTGKP
jgi:hypothetical protein